MKLTKKLELCTGIATFITTLLYFCFITLGFVFLSIKYDREININGELIIFGVMFVLILLSSVMVALGAYFDAKGSDMAIDSLYAGGGFMIFVMGFLGFIVLAFGGGWLGVLAYIPVILTVMTIILALSSREKASSDIFKL